ncbi:MAG: hypothetical protein ACPGVS_06665 [Primorskyibacter sp.]
MALGFYRGLGSGLLGGCLGALVVATAFGVPERLRPAIPLANPPVTETAPVVWPNISEAPTRPAVRPTTVVRPAMPEPLAPATEEQTATPEPTAPRLSALPAPNAVPIPRAVGDALPSEPDSVTPPQRGRAEAIGTPQVRPDDSRAVVAVIPADPITPAVGDVADSPAMPTAPSLPQPLVGFDTTVNVVNPAGISAPDAGADVFGGPVVAPRAVPQVDSVAPQAPPAPDTLSDF